MHKILVINSKGGSGKTTLATNIASYYANSGEETALMDYDPQGSSLQWLKLRPAGVPGIYGADASKKKGSVIRSWRMVIPFSTKHLVIDAPAGIDGLMLQDLVQRADTIVIPVAPSSIDIHATSDFIRDMFLLGKVRREKTRIAVVANRVRDNGKIYDPLHRFLNSLQIPYLTSITDTDNYIFAAEKGIGIFEMELNTTLTERMELMPLFEWLDGKNDELKSSVASTTEQKPSPAKNADLRPGRLLVGRSNLIH